MTCKYTYFSYKTRKGYKINGKAIIKSLKGYVYTHNDFVNYCYSFPLPPPTNKLTNNSSFPYSCTGIHIQVYAHERCKI